MVAVTDVSIYVVIELANVGDVKPHTGVRLYADFIYNLMMFSVHLVTCRPYNT